jgi:ribosomal protein S18 acetylase RimI-like enzyme
VELCFEASLDADGRRFIRQMRQAASQRRGYPGSSGMPSAVKGYVWVEKGEIVGNINLIPVTIQQRRAYLVANVAVHPDYRQQGIARALTEAGLARISSIRASTAVLQVDANNHIAHTLYRSYGFTETARRTTWHGDSNNKIKMPPSITVRERRRSDWPQQRKWLELLYNRHVRWNLPLRHSLYAPGLLGLLARGLNEHKIRQWTAAHHGQWIGSLIWQSSYNLADWLWLSAPPDKLELAICSLIPAAREQLLQENLIKPGRILAVNFSAGQNQSAFEAIGYRQHNTLIWMQKNLR